MYYVYWFGYFAACTSGMVGGLVCDSYDVASLAVDESVVIESPTVSDFERVDCSITTQPGLRIYVRYGVVTQDHILLTNKIVMHLFLYLDVNLVCIPDCRRSLRTH